MFRYNLFDEADENSTEREIYLPEIKPELSKEFLISEDINADMYTLQKLFQVPTNEVNWNS